MLTMRTIQKTDANKAIGHANTKRIMIQIRAKQGFPAMIYSFSLEVHRL